MKISNRCVCDNCAYESSKWLGKCPACRLWNTLQEEARGSRMAIPGKPRTEAVSLQSVPTQDIRRGLSGVAEFDRVLGGGMVPGSVILLGGNRVSANPHCCCRWLRPSPNRAMRSLPVREESLTADSPALPAAQG